MFFEKLATGPLSVNTYLIGDDSGTDCIVIDPGDTPLALHGNARGIPASRLRCVEIHERKD